MAINPTGGPISIIPQPDAKSPGNPFDKVDQPTYYAAYEAVSKNPTASNSDVGTGRRDEKRYIMELAWNTARIARADLAINKALDARAVNDANQQFGALLVNGLQGLHNPSANSGTPPASIDEQPGNPFNKDLERTAYDAYNTVLTNPLASNPYAGKNSFAMEREWDRGAEAARSGTVSSNRLTLRWSTRNGP